MQRLPFVALVLLVGCTYTRPLDLGAPADRQRVTQRAGQQTPVIVVSGRAPIQAPLLSVGADSTTWIDPDTRQPVSVASSEVNEVRFPTSHPRPARAFWQGLVGGVVVGAAIGYIGYDGPGWIVSSHAESAAVMGTAGAILGGGVGGLISLDRMSPETYTRPSPTPRDLP